MQFFNANTITPFLDHFRPILVSFLHKCVDFGAFFFFLRIESGQDPSLRSLYTVYNPIILEATTPLQFFFRT